MLWVEEAIYFYFFLDIMP